MRTSGADEPPGGDLEGGWRIEPSGRADRDNVAPNVAPNLPPNDPDADGTALGRVAVDAENASATADAKGPPEGAPGSASEQLSSVSLMLLGVFGGLYLLYTWCWFMIARAYSVVNAVTAEGSGVIGGVLQQVIFWVAPFAPLTWFLAVWLLTRNRKPAVLGLALVVGALVLLPLPWFMGGGAA